MKADKNDNTFIIKLKNEKLATIVEFEEEDIKMNIDDEIPKIDTHERTIQTSLRGVVRTYLQKIY